MSDQSFAVDVSFPVNGATVIVHVRAGDPYTFSDYVAAAAAMFPEAHLEGRGLALPPVAAAPSPAAAPTPLRPPAPPDVPAPVRAPACPDHAKPMKPSTKGSGWFCPAKTAEGYCQQKAS